MSRQPLSIVAALSAPEALKARSRVYAAAAGARSPNPSKAAGPSSADVTVALRALGLSSPQIVTVKTGVAAAGGNISFEAVLSLLPLKIANQIMASRNKATLEMLRAWGRSLRKEALRAKKSREERDKKKVVVTHQQQADALRRDEAKRLLSAARSAEARARNVQWNDDVLSGPAASPRVGGAIASQGLLGSGLNLPTREALSLPLLAGVSLRSPVLRLRSLA